MSMLDHKLEPKAVRRVEVITGAGGRRRFSDDEKSRIIEEALVPGAVISGVARRNGLTPQQLFTWLRQVRRRDHGAGSRSRPRANQDRPVVRAMLVMTGPGAGATCTDPSS